MSAITTPPLTITTREEIIQEQILQAAKRLFTVHGLAKVTMDDVAKAIGKGRSSLYYYYKSKDEIFDAVFNMEMQEMLSAMEKAVDQAATIEKKINAFFITKLMVIREKGAFFDALKIGMDADALTDFHKTKIAHHNLVMQREGELLTLILNEGTRQGELKSILKDDLDTLIFVLLSSIRGLRNELNLGNNEMEIETVISGFTRVILHGLIK